MASNEDMQEKITAWHSSWGVLVCGQSPEAGYPRWEGYKCLRKQRMGTLPRESVGLRGIAGLQGSQQDKNGSTKRWEIGPRN